MSTTPPPPPPTPPPPPPFGAVGSTPGWPAPVPAIRPEYAGWWQRAFAQLIDVVITWILLVPGLVVLFTGPTQIRTCDDIESGNSFPCETPSDGTLAIGLLLLFVAVVGYLVVYIRMLGRGATWGRRAMGYRVVDERTLQPIGTGRATGRYFATILSGMPCYLGWLWPLWDDENRTFHDMIVKTRAVRD